MQVAPNWHKNGKRGTMTDDYKPNGMTTLFAALNILEGTVIARGMKRHLHHESIRFLNAVERAISGGKLGHAIVGKYVAHMGGRSSAPAISTHSDFGLMDQRGWVSCPPSPPPSPTPSLPFRQRSDKR